MADLKSLLGDKYKEGMTIEDILALEVEEPKADTSAYDNLKKRFDEVASEAAGYKKQLRANMSEADQKAAAAKEELDTKIEEIRQKIEKLKMFYEFITRRTDNERANYAGIYCRKGAFECESNREKDSLRRG